MEKPVFNLSKHALEEYSKFQLPEDYRLEGDDFLITPEGDNQIIPASFGYTNIQHAHGIVEEVEPIFEINEDEIDTLPDSDSLLFGRCTIWVSQDEEIAKLKGCFISNPDEDIYQVALIKESKAK